MNEVTRARLFQVSNAFDHPVTRWIVIGVAGLLVVAPLVLLALGAMGKLNAEHKKELWQRYKSWLVLVPLMAGPVLMGAAATIGAVCILSLLCYREFARGTGLFRETLTSRRGSTGDSGGEPGGRGPLVRVLCGVGAPDDRGDSRGNDL